MINLKKEKPEEVIVKMECLDAPEKVVVKMEENTVKEEKVDGKDATDVADAPDGTDAPDMIIGMPMDEEDCEEERFEGFE